MQNRNNSMLVHDCAHENREVPLAAVRSFMKLDATIGRERRR